MTRRGIKPLGKNWAGYKYKLFEGDDYHIFDYRGGENPILRQVVGGKKALIWIVIYMLAGLLIQCKGYGFYYTTC